jgi:hypothetical protein
MVVATANLSSIYPMPDVLTYMEHQAEAFDRMKPQLIEQFLHQYVWFEDGKVLDSDGDHETLVLRCYGDDEARPLFIRKVVRVEPQYVVRSPMMSH